MANYEAGENVGAVFHALADATRRAMVERLVRSPASVSELAALSDSALPTILKHLRVLEDAGIVESQKAGRVRTYQLVPDSTVSANDWLVQQRRPQERRLDRLGDYLVAEKAPARRPRRRGK